MTGLDLRAATHERLQSRALEQNCSIDDMINRVLDDTVSTSTLPYQDMLNSTSDIIALFDLDFRYVYVNVSIEAITGLAPPEMIGKTHRELNMPEEQILYWESIYHEVLTTRQEKVLRFNFPSVDGQGYYETRLTPVLNARGDIECVLGITRDITDRKRVEDDLRRSETNLRAMFNITWQSFIIIDRDYRIIDADEKGKKVAEAIFGKPIVPGDSIHDFVLARDRDSFAANFLSAVNGQRVTIEKMFESLPGQTSYYEVTYDPLVDHEGTIIGVCMSYHDITERKLSQLALSNSEADYRLLAQNVTDMISRHAPDGVYTFVTPSSEVLLGYTSEDLIGHQAYEFFHPDDVPVVRQSHDSVLKQPLVSIIQYRIRRKDGEYIWFETSSRTIQDALTGESTEIIAVSRDISERKRIEEALSRSEARLRSLVETQTAFVVRTDLNGNYTYVNPSFSNLYHWFSDNLLQQSMLDTVLPEDRDKAIAAAELCLAKPGQSVQVTLRKTVPPNEDIFWTLWEFVAIQDADDVITEIQCVGFDISEQIQAQQSQLEQERLKSNLKKEQQFNALIQKAVYILAHDIRIPLTIINMAKETLERYFDRIDEDKRREKLDSIGRQLHYVVNLLDTVTMMVKGTFDNAAFKPASVNLEALCRLYIDEIQATIGLKHQLRFLTDGGIKTALVDETLVSRILINLLSNAVKYSPDMSKIDLELSQRENWIVLRISDQGMGIADEDQQHVLEPFYRTQSAQHITGTGLGLSIVKDCVERHQGIILLNSTLGQGTTFTIELPLR